jgi:fibronectin-binding autotransporter adhesin
VTPHFHQSGYTLSSGTLNFGTKPGIFVAAGKSATIQRCITGSPGVSKYGTGTLTLSGNNTYSGATVINAGTISVGVLANGGSSSNLGASSSSAAHLVFLGGTLNYTGTGHSTDRLFTIGAGGGTLISSGSGALNLTNTGSVAFNGAGNRTLTLSGTNTGNNILAASVSNNGGNATSITKSGSGRWILTGNNSATGTVTISGGTLQIGNGGTSGSIAGNVTTAAICFQPIEQLYLWRSDSSSGTVTKKRSGTLILSGIKQHYTGNTTVSNGTLIVTGATAAGEEYSKCKQQRSNALGGTGTVSGTVNIASGAYLSPGNGGNWYSLNRGTHTWRDISSKF